MKKKLFLLFLAVVMALPLCFVLELPVAAASSGTAGNCKWSISDYTLTISGNGRMENYSYSSGAPWGTTISKVVIKNGVTSIGNYAFYGCKNLTSITIPDSVTSIGRYAFSGCTSLTSVAIGNGVTSISGSAFYYCPGLISITIPDSVTSIGESAFSSCTSLTSITIPDSVTFIGESAFSYCTSLTSVTVPDNVTSIGGSAFYNTAYYNDGNNWDGDVLYIGKHLIKAKTSISGSCIIKGGTKTIADYAFEYCRSLTSVTLPNSVTSIGDVAFGGYSPLTDVWYSGTERDRNNITINTGNDALFSATWHYVDNACDTTCNECGATRTTTHTYDNVCDTTCNVCGYVRTPIHDYKYEKNTAVHWKKCSACGEIDKESYAQHDYSSWELDETEHWIICLDCGIIDEETRETHDFDNACDTTCDECGYVRQVPEHVYDNICDADCNVCGYTRPAHDYSVQEKTTETHWMKCSVCGTIDEETRENHSFDNNCDTTCNVCGYVRQVPEHVYDNICDTTCNVCGAERTVPPHNYSVENKDATNHWLECSSCSKIDESTREVHIYDNACDTTCNKCELKRTVPPHNYSVENKDATNHWTECSICKNIDEESFVPHDYSAYDKNSALHWKICSVCGTIDETSFTAHAYDSVCDPECVCGTTREVTHNFSTQDKDATGHWIKCSVCGTIDEETRENHSFDNNCDTTCNVCGATRSVPAHVYDNTCDTTCNECGATRTTTHIYDNACDKTCNVCGETRTVGAHSYSDTCDSDCNVCGAVRTAPHDYDNACDATCNNCTVTRTVPDHVYDNDVDETCNVCDAKRVIPRDLVLSFSKSTVDHGETFTVSVSLSKPVISQGFALNYAEIFDQDAFEFVSGTWSDAVKSQSLMAPANNGQAAFVAQNEFEISGEIFILTLRVKDMAKCGTQKIEAPVITQIQDVTRVGGEVTVNHIYDDAKDLVCNACGYERHLYTPGDVDGIPGISTDDAIYLLFAINFPDEYPVNQPIDFDGNGLLDTDDAIYLLFHVNFPESYPLH